MNIRNEHRKEQKLMEFQMRFIGERSKGAENEARHLEMES
jgi:hypothetical protein